MFSGDKNISMLEMISEVFPDVHYQHCVVHFYCNIFHVTPRNKMKTVAMMLKVIHAQESKEDAREKAVQIAEKLQEMKLSSTVKIFQDGIEKNVYIRESRICTNSPIDRLNR